MSLLIITCNRERVIDRDLIDYGSRLLKFGDQYFTRFGGTGQEDMFAEQGVSTLASILQQGRSDTFSNIFNGNEVSCYAVVAQSSRSGRANSGNAYVRQVLCMETQAL